MRGRKLIVVLLVIGGSAILLVAFIRPPRRPVEMQLVGAEPSGMVSDDGTEAIMVTLKVSNRDYVAIMFDRAATCEARIGEHWFQVEQPVSLGRIAAGQGAEESLVVPGATRALRLRLSYQSETWKSRLMV